MLKANINFGRGDTPNTPEVFQQNILNSLSSIPNAISEDLSQGNLDLGIKTKSGGAAGGTGTLVAMNALPSQLVCQPGEVLVNDTQCGKCKNMTSELIIFLIILSQKMNQNDAHGCNNLGKVVDPVNMLQISYHH